MIAAAVQQRWSILFGLAIGLVLSLSAFSTDSLLKGYDELYPVVDMRGELVESSPDSVFIRVTGKKNRACEYVALQAYYRSADGTMRDAYRERIGVGETRSTKPVGYFDIGVWRVWPRRDAVAVLMYTTHECSGRVVVTKVAEVML